MKKGVNLQFIHKCVNKNTDIKRSETKVNPKYV
jgi:hypothetical protein